MFWDAVIFLSICTLLYFIVVNRGSRARNFPPGPRQLPIIGNLLDMQTFNHVTMKALAKQYGGIYTFKIMKKHIFVVTNIDLAWEALVHKGNIFAGRSDSYVANTLYHGKQAIVFGDFGARWKLLRKVAHSALRMFGNGIENLEQKVHREAEELCRQLSESRGVPIDPKRFISLAVMNVICSCLFEARFSEGDQFLEEMFEMVDEAIYLAGAAVLLEIFPFMKYLPLEVHKRIKHSIDLREKLFSSKFEERKKTYKEGTIRDITDAFIKALSDAEIEDSKTKGILDDTYLKNTLIDLTAAGSDTVASFLTWAFLYLVAFPEVQAKVHQEIDNVLGRNRLPRFEDRSRLPYLEATIMEIMRHSSFAYETVPHRVRSDTTLGGYEIPENSEVLFDLRAIHHDPSHWRDPDSFDPTRFLDEEGSFICPATLSFLPFGGGQRGCLGQTLAKIEIFLSLTRVLQQFRLELPPGSSQPDLEAPVEAMPRGILLPTPYTLCVAERD